LLADGHALRIFELPRVEPYRRFGASECLEWITGDFQNVSDLRRAIDGVDAVLHLVSTTLPKGSNEDPVYDVNTNVISTIQMLNTMVKTEVKRLIFISSGGTVYGVPHAIPIPEDHPTNPEVSYGITKLMIEKYLYLYNRLHGLEPSSSGPPIHMENVRGPVPGKALWRPSSGERSQESPLKSGAMGLSLAITYTFQMWRALSRLPCNIGEQR
jgi:nucleoside-diphosphate-sugar epimerase